MSRTLTISVDDDAFVRAMHETEEDLDRVVSLFAVEVARDVAQEAGKVSERLGKAWEIEGVGGYERRVSAPEWWAHFLAGGTAAHGPSRAPYLTFTIGDQFVAAERVRGIGASHFDEEGIARARGRMDDILHRALG